MSELLTFAVSNAEIIATSPLPTMTAGMRNHIVCQFSFGDEWTDLDKMAMFRADGGTPYRVPDYEWGDDNTVELPQEVTSVGGKNVDVGVYGFNEEGVAIPTLWIDIGKVKFGVSNEATAPHGTTLTDWERLTYQLRDVMNTIGDLAALDTEAKVNLVAAINEVFERSSGGAVDIQDRLDAWRAEHPFDDIVGFLRTILEPGLYTFFDNDYLAIYELTFSTEDGDAGEYYGRFDRYDEGTVDWRHFVYTGETVAGLAKNEDLEPVNRKYLADQGYLSATAGSAPAGVEMQNVYKDTEGNLVTPTGSGGGGGTLDHRQLTHRNDADQHSISAITGLQTALDGKLPLSAGADYPLAGDLYMAVGGNKRIRRLGDPLSDYDAVNLRTLRSHKASEEYFGGIKAQARDASTDTQEVKIDTDTGILYAEKYVINVTWGNPPTAEETLADVVQLIADGKTVSAKTNYKGSAGNIIEFDLKFHSSNVVSFEASVNGAIIWLRCRSTGWDIVQKEFAITISEASTDNDIPTALAVYNYVSETIGDTAGALSSLDNTLDGLDVLIGGDSA